MRVFARTARPIGTICVATPVLRRDYNTVAYWGGTLEILDGAHNMERCNTFSQDITALTSLGGRLLAGLADGRVVALALK